MGFIRPTKIKIKFVNRERRKYEGINSAAAKIKAAKAKESIKEESPPSAKAERFIKKNKESFKDKYGERWKEVLYSTAWKMHNKHWNDKE